MSEKIENFFKTFIGQSKVIGYLNRLLTFKSNPKHEAVPIKPIALVGNAGLGKTLLAGVIANVLHGLDASWNLVEISSSVTKAQFLEIWTRLIEGKNVIIFIDEAGTNSMKRRDLINLIKRLTETQGQVKTVTDSARGMEFTLTADLSKQFWILCTNEEISDTAMFGESGRFHTLNLELYTLEERKELIKHFASMHKMAMNQAVVDYLADKVVGTGRAINELIGNEVLLASQGHAVSLETAKQTVAEYGRFKGGLRSVDIKTLRFIGQEEQGKQVQEIAAHCAENESLTSDRLRMLSGLSFVRTHAGKKKLTEEGRKYYAEVIAELKAKREAKGKTTTKTVKETAKA